MWSVTEKQRLENTTMIVLVITLLFAMAAADPCDVIGPKWKQLDPTVSDSCYFFSSKEKTFAKAEARCANKAPNYGSHLVQIDNAGENQMIAGAITKTSWIGAHLVSGSWEWVGSGDAVTYNNWHSNEPNDHKDDEDCAQMYSDGFWNDQRCSKTILYICEASPVNCGTPTSISHGTATAVCTAVNCEATYSCSGNFPQVYGPNPILCGSDGSWAQPPACVAHLHQLNGSGNITSPNHPENYPNGVEVYWLIDAGTNMKVKLEFVVFNVEPSGGCRFDDVQVRDGQYLSSQLMLSYCDHHLPNPTIYTSTGQYLTVYFRTDGSVTYSGFLATYESIPQ
ncbi:hypothetical protein ScPMuIL_003001 [Solemya velum]